MFGTPSYKEKMMHLQLTREEIVCLRSSLGAELDILDEELDDSRNKNDINVSRTRMLNKRILLDKILQKVQKVHKSIQTFRDL